MGVIKLDFGIQFFEKENLVDSNKDDNINEFEWFDFGSNHSYFIVLLDQHKDSKTLVNTLEGKLEGHYYWICITSKSSQLFYIGVNSRWLSSQVKYCSDLESVIVSVLSNWSNKHSLFSARYFAFTKEYQRTPTQELLIKSYFSQLLYFFVNDIIVEISKRTAQDIKSIEMQVIKQIEEKITYEFHKPIPSVKEMARMAGMSVSKFKLLFHEVYGTSPHQYVLEKKMIYAKDLLQTGKYSITQVAYKVGYLYVSGFTRIYKQKFNDLPSTTYFEKQH